MHIDDETTDVLIGGYLSERAAHEDYDSALNCGERLWGAVVVSKDLEGNLTVEESDHAVEEGAAGFAGVGFVVGLFAPPLLAATAIGAALGAVGGEALHKKLGKGIGEQAGDTIPIGGAGLISPIPRSAAETGRGVRHPRRQEGRRRSRRAPCEGPQGRAGRRPAEDGRELNPARRGWLCCSWCRTPCAKLRRWSGRGRRVRRRRATGRCAPRRSGR